MWVWGGLCLSRIIDSWHRPSEAAHSLGVGLNSLSVSAGTEGPGSAEGFSQLYIHLAKHVILRKLVGGETEIGSFTEVIVTWQVIYRISGK